MEEDLKIKICVICRKNPADSAEHFYKKSILAKEIEEFKKQNIKIKAISLNPGYKKLYPIQGPDSKSVKYEKSICKNCNGNISSDADRSIDSIVKDITAVLSSTGTLVDSFGLPLILTNLKELENQLILRHTYMIFFKLDLFGIYEYLEFKNIANIVSKDEFPKLSNEIEQMILTLQENNIGLQFVKTKEFYGKVINYFADKNKALKPLVEKYFAKQVICSLDSRGIPIPDGLRAIFFQKDYSKKVRVRLYVLRPWINELPVSYLHDFFVNSKGELVVSFYQEYSRTHAFLIYFTFNDLSEKNKFHFKEKVFTKKWFSGYVERFKTKV